MKILLITYYWPPCGGPGVQRALKFARYLPEHSIYPYVITVDEKKASYPVIDQSLCDDVPANVKVFRTDTSEPFGFYSAFSKNKEIPHSGFANEGNPGIMQRFSRFIRGNFFIPDARKGWNKYAYEKISELLRSEKFDAFMTSSPPHSTQLLGLRIKKETGLPWIADLRDPWTDIYYYKDMLHLGFAKRKDAEYEKAVLEKADQIIVVSPAIQRIFEKKSDKIDSRKIHVIPNGFDEHDFTNNSVVPEKEFVITYTGTIAMNYGIRNFIQVIAGFVKQGKHEIRLRFVGNVGSDVKTMITEEGVAEHTEYLGYLQHKESVGMLLQSTILLLAIPQIDKNEGILTGKLFEYLASGKQIICIGPEKGDAANIINDCKAGKVFDYGEKEAIANYLSSMLSLWEKEPSLDRKNDLHLKYSRRMLTSQLADVIKNRAAI